MKTTALILILPCLSWAASKPLVSTATWGTAQLVEGQATVRTAALTPSSVVLVTPVSATQNSIGSISVINRSDRVGFTIQSSFVKDDRAVQWIILMPTDFDPTRFR
jgi:hypothetical protein